MSKSKFDEYLKDQTGTPDLFGYSVLPNNDMDYKNHFYGVYYNNDEFARFCKEMKENYSEIYNAYANGKGSELIGTPPKMASVASSSRFCYLALRDASITDIDKDVKVGKTKFEFEKDLPVKVIDGQNPQIDAFYDSEDSVYFFEFKCHEIFDNHDKTLSRQYDKFLQKWDIPRDSDKIPSYEFGGQFQRFDLKQFITHLTGISCHNCKGKKKIFSYVFFEPNCDSYNGVNFKIIYNKLRDEIKQLFSCDNVKYICQLSDYIIKKEKNSNEIINDKGIELRAYFYRNNKMEGFDKTVKPELYISSNNT